MFKLMRLSASVGAVCSTSLPSVSWERGEPVVKDVLRIQCTDLGQRPGLQQGLEILPGQGEGPQGAGAARLRNFRPGASSDRAGEEKKAWHVPSFKGCVNTFEAHT